LATPTFQSEVSGHRSQLRTEDGLESLVAALATALVAKLDRSCSRFAKQPGQIAPATSLVTPFGDRPRKCDMSVDLRYWRGALGGCDDGGWHD